MNVDSFERLISVYKKPTDRSFCPLGICSLRLLAYWYLLWSLAKPSLSAVPKKHIEVLVCCTVVSLYQNEDSPPEPDFLYMYLLFSISSLPHLGF